MFIDNHEPKHIADQIQLALNDTSLRKEWLQNIPKAQNELHWGHEEKGLKEVYSEIEK